MQRNTLAALSAAAALLVAGGSATASAATLRSEGRQVAVRKLSVHARLPMLPSSRYHRSAPTATSAQMASAAAAVRSLSTQSVTSTAPFAIYYGWPSEVNGANYDLTKAVAAFAGFRVVVFGEGNVTSGGDTNAGTIMAGVAKQGGAPYGYVTIGVSDGEPNYSLTTIHTMLDSWKRLGARGVLFDCAGYDYGVSRTRFVDVVSYAHSLGLKVLTNAWNPDDVLSGATPLGVGDGYLGENDVYSGGQWQAASTYQPKLAKMAAYKQSLGITLYETATSPQPAAAGDVVAQILQALAPYHIDYFQLTDPNYSADSNVLTPPDPAVTGS